MTYDAFRHFADTWGLLGLLMFFVGSLYVAFRRGKSETHSRLARLPLDDED
ncbi:MAG: cbb3-type cytochrome c oxidase subunit 3 [Parvibaculaceae bacterium]